MDITEQIVKHLNAASNGFTGWPREEWQERCAAEIAEALFPDESIEISAGGWSVDVRYSEGGAALLCATNHLILVESDGRAFAQVGFSKWSWDEVKSISIQSFRSGGEEKTQIGIDTPSGARRRLLGVGSSRLRKAETFVEYVESRKLG